MTGTAPRRRSAAALQSHAPQEHRADEEFAMVFDSDLMAPACVLLQAAFGCSSHPRPMSLFEPRHWLVAPTPGMRKVSGTLTQWEKVAAMTRERWRDGTPRLAARPAIDPASVEPGRDVRRRTGGRGCRVHAVSLDRAQVQIEDGSSKFWMNMSTLVKDWY